jgi:hypothetical protein
VFTLAGCRSAKITSNSEHSERSAQTRVQIQTQIDSILVYKHDSIYIREKNDTVFVEKWHTKIAYRDRLRVDTLRSSDTIRISDIVTETKEIEVNRISGWQNFQIYAGRILFLGLLLFIGFKIISRKA